MSADPWPLDDPMIQTCEQHGHMEWSRELWDAAKACPRCLTWGEYQPKGIGWGI